jgi:hypothetical protein
MLCQVVTLGHVSSDYFKLGQVRSGRYRLVLVVRLILVRAD